MSACNVGWAGIALGCLAFFVAVPPITLRTPTVPILIGLLALGAGVWSAAGGERRVGWGAVAASAVWAEYVHTGPPLPNPQLVAVIVPGRCSIVGVKNTIR